MKVNKKLFFKIHSWIGVKLSILFFIICFSGTLATLSHEMDWLFNPAIRAQPQEKLAERNTIIANFREHYPNAKITYWLRNDEPYLCDLIYKEENERRSYVFANPYTGQIQGESFLTIQRFFRDLHYFLFVPFYQIGYFTVLIFSFLLLASTITALCFYKKWWKKLFVLQTGKGVLVFLRSLHRFVGVWSVPFAILFSITGIWYFLERSNIADIRMEANPSQPIIEVPDSLGFRESRSGGNVMFNVDYDKAIALAKKEIPELVVGSIAPPHDLRDNIYLTGKSDVPLVRQRANRVYVNPHTYSVSGVQKAKSISFVTWLNDIADPLHFGYWGGLTTKVIWFFAGLCISTLILSGIWITLKRRALKQNKTNEKVMGLWRYVNWGVSVIILFFMYYTMIDRYWASSSVILTVTIGWAVVMALSYYVFYYRLKKVRR